MAKRIHMIGIGGTGMSALARCLIARGFQVSGSDAKSPDDGDRLVRNGITLFKGHHPSNIPAHTDVVVHSAAIKDDNAELAEARKRGIEVKKYARALGDLMKERKGIAVSGCHGKTTTTAMIAYIMHRAGLDPSFVCGGHIPQLDGNGAAGKGNYFVAEACEYDRSFLNLSPQAAVITNIEEDHLDYYKDIGEIAGAFREFATLVGDNGVVIGCGDNPHAAKITESFKDRGETYGIASESHWRAKNPRLENGVWHFDVLKYGKPLGEFMTPLPGLHNVSNAVAAIATTSWAGVGVELIQLALGEFTGVTRRFQVLGERKGVTIVDDYAHHPTEIQAVLKAAKERFPDRKIWAVFQPHQHSRTRIMLKEFARSFADAHLVLLPDIFYARDDQQEVKKISSSHLAAVLDEVGKAALYMPTFDAIVDFLGKNAEPGTVVFTLGAGNVGEIGARFLQQ